MTNTIWLPEAILDDLEMIFDLPSCPLGMCEWEVHHKRCPNRSTGHTFEQIMEDVLYAVEAYPDIEDSFIQDLKKAYEKGERAVVELLENTTFKSVEEGL